MSAAHLSIFMDLHKKVSQHCYRTLNLTWHAAACATRCWYLHAVAIATPDCLSAAGHRRNANKLLQRQVRTPHMPCAGLLFDCDEHGGAVAGHINLREAEPMQMAGLWSCIYDAMHCNREISSILNLTGNSKVSLTTDCTS